MRSSHRELVNPIILPHPVQEKAPGNQGRPQQSRSSPQSGLPIGLLLSSASPPTANIKLESFGEATASLGKRKTAGKGRESMSEGHVMSLLNAHPGSLDAQLPPLISSPKAEDSSTPPSKDLQMSGEEELREGLSERFKEFFSEGFPVPSKPVTSAVVCICNMFASEKMGTIDLHKFATLLNPIPANGKMGILGVSYGEIVKGLQKKSSKQFAHQAQLRLRLEGADNVVVKMFKTGQMQTCGCPSVEISYKAVRTVVEALNDLLKDKHSEGLLQAQANEINGQIKTLSPDNLEVKVVNTNCSFDAGYSDKGYALNLPKLVTLLSKPEVADAVERVEFDPESHYAGAKVYFKPSNYGEIQENGAAQRPVFVGVFPSSKCVITGAASNWIATQAYEFMSKFLVDKYEELREISLELLANRGMNQGNGDSRPKKRRRKSAKALSNLPLGALGLALGNGVAALAAIKKDTTPTVHQKNGTNGKTATSSESKAPKKTSHDLEICLQLPDKLQPLVLRKAVNQSETLADLRKWVKSQASKPLSGRSEWLRSLAFVGGKDTIVGQDDEHRTAASTMLPQVRLAQLEVAQAAEALLLGLRG